MTHAAKAPGSREHAFAWTCPTCRKRSYPTKRAAKAVARRLADGLWAYACDANPERVWHIGHHTPGRPRDDFRRRVTHTTPPTAQGPAADADG